MDVICESCGSTNRSAGEFCTECGAFLGWDGHPSAGAPAEKPAEPAQRGQPEVHTGTAPPPRTADQPMRSAPPPRPADSVPTRTAVLAAVPDGPACPTCWKINEPGRRFCAKCGTLLSAPQPAPAGQVRANAELRRRERADKRAFRNSLPAVYRWRRIGLIALAVALTAGLAIIVASDPVGWGRARWYDIKGSLVAVPGVRATVLPPADGRPEASAGDPALLVDGTAADWHTRWTATRPAPNCEGGTDTPTIELTLAEPIRIRGIDIYAGLGADQPQRAAQLVPQSIGVTPVGAGPCQRFPLTASADVQRLRFDSRQSVSVIRISIDSAYPASPDAVQRLSIREIQLLSRPR